MRYRAYQWTVLTGTLQSIEALEAFQILETDENRSGFAMFFDDDAFPAVSCALEKLREFVFGSSGSDRHPSSVSQNGCFDYFSQI